MSDHTRIGLYTASDSVGIRAPRVRQVRIRADSSFWESVAAHRRAFRALHLDLEQVNLANPFVARDALIASYSLGPPTVTVVQPLKRTFSAPAAANVAVANASAGDIHRWSWIGGPSSDARRASAVDDLAPPGSTSHES